MLTGSWKDNIMLLPLCSDLGTFMTLLTSLKVSWALAVSQNDFDLTTWREKKKLLIQSQSQCDGARRCSLYRGLLNIQQWGNILDLSNYWTSQLACWERSFSNPLCSRMYHSPWWRYVQASGQNPASAPTHPLYELTPSPDLARVPWARNTLIRKTVPRPACDSGVAFRTCISRGLLFNL